MKNEDCETLFDSDLLYSLTDRRSEEHCQHSKAISQELRAIQDHSEAVSKRIMSAWPLEHGTEHLYAILYALDRTTTDSWLIAYAAKEHFARSVAEKQKVAELLEQFFDELKAGLTNSAAPVRQD